MLMKWYNKSTHRLSVNIITLNINTITFNFILTILITYYYYYVNVIIIHHISSYYMNIQYTITLLRYVFLSDDLDNNDNMC